MTRTRGGALGDARRSDGEVEPKRGGGLADLRRSLGVGYSVVKQLTGSPDPDSAYQRAQTWFSGALSDGVYLLRVTLRHDLGVETEPDFEQTRLRMLATLDGARDSLVHLLAAERAQAPGTVGGPR